MKNLLIVESPNKIKTIKKYLGNDWQVVASVGHIRDLPKKTIGIDFENNYTPQYETYTDKKDVIKNLKNAINSCENIYLATDQDREGEAIAFHICEIANLDKDNTHRVTFNELSKKAINDAIAKPRTLDMNLVDAQQSRRVIDRIVGYKVSPRLTSALEHDSYLSAGRVQSAALKMVVETENEIINFEPIKNFRIKGIFETEKQEKITANYTEKLSDQETSKEKLQQLLTETYHVSNVESKDNNKKPYPPFTTSSLQQQANKILNYNLATTTKIAQSLYEKGLVTYIRTDSISISDDAKEMIQQKLSSDYGEGYYTNRVYKNNIAGAQEAHEAIRPTDLDNNTEELSDHEKDLYNLIYNRTLASFLPDLITTTQTITIENTSNDIFLSKTSVIKEQGWTILYADKTDDEQEQEEDNKIENPPKINDSLQPLEFEAKTSLTKPPSRFTEATIVKELEKKGIGRPSTFAATINILFKRSYIELGNHPGKNYDSETITISNAGIQEKNGTITLGKANKKILPTKLGITVINYLESKFTKIMDYEFTNQCEQKFDDIASGQKSYQNVVHEFYIPFQKIIESLPEPTTPKSNRRKLGDYKDAEITIGKGKYGYFIHHNDKFHSLPKDENPKNITLEKAIAVIETPEKQSNHTVLGKHKNKDVKVGAGQYGTYILFDKIYSAKDYTPENMDLETAIKIINGEIRDKNVIGTYKNKPIKIGKSQYGFYINHNNKFYSVNQDPSNMNEDEAISIINTPKPKSKPKKIRSKYGKR